MLLVRRMLIVLVVGGLLSSFLVLGQVPPPNTGKMSWDLFQTVAAGQRKRAVGEEVKTVSALLVTSNAATQQDLSALETLGYTILGAFGQFVMVQAPADYFADPKSGVDAMAFVSNATLPPVTITSAGEATPITNGAPAIGTSQVWAHGYQGKGTKIAVIDAGFDPNDPTLAQLDSTFYSVNPTGKGIGAYEAVEGEAAQGSNHGTSCAIIAGDVAPEAKLYLLSYPTASTLIGWLSALDYAVHTLKVDVVTTSVEFSLPTCHADGTGPLNEAVSEILAGTNTLLVTAAGNWAQGDRSDRTFYAGTLTDSDGDYEHDFTQTASDTWDRNTLRFSAHEGDWVTIILEWDDWTNDVKVTDLDLILYDAKYRVPLAFSQAQQLGNETNPMEIISGELPYSGDYCLAVVDHAAKWGGQQSHALSFHLNLFNRNEAFGLIEHHTACGSVREVATNPDVVTVGAISVEDGTVREYSSRGPTASGIEKPDLYAPDGVTGTIYHTFYGTSASAPYAAGAIALVHSIYPDSLKQEELARLQGRKEESAASTSETGQSGDSIAQKADTLCTDNCGNPLYRLNLAGIIQE